MKLSAWVFSSDLLVGKKQPFLNGVIERFTKQNIFGTNSTITFHELKKGGVDGIELLVNPNITDNELAEIKNKLSNSKIPVLSVHQPLTNVLSINVDIIERLCEVAQFFSVEIVVVHLFALRQNVFNKKFIQRLHHLEEKYQVKIALENDPRHYLSLFKPYVWREQEFSSLVRSLGFSITLDTTHLAQTGGDIFQFYNANKASIKNIHLSDYRKSFANKNLLLTKDTHLPLQRGELPLEAFLRILKNDSYNGLITMEINAPLHELVRSAEMIKKVIK